MFEKWKRKEMAVLIAIGVLQRNNYAQYDFLLSNRFPFVFFPLIRWRSVCILILDHCDKSLILRMILYKQQRQSTEIQKTNKQMTERKEPKNK